MKETMWRRARQAWWTVCDTARRAYQWWLVRVVRVPHQLLAALMWVAELATGMLLGAGLMAALTMPRLPVSVALTGVAMVTALVGIACEGGLRAQRRLLEASSVPMHWR